MLQPCTNKAVCDLIHTQCVLWADKKTSPDIIKPLSVFHPIFSKTDVVGNSLLETREEEYFLCGCGVVSLWKQMFLSFLMIINIHHCKNKKF